MANTIHAFDYLEQPPALGAVQVVFGDEPFLKRLVLERMQTLACPDGDAPAAVFDGDTVEWRDVRDELQTVSLFNASGLRVAIIEQGDRFVSENRGRLEDYVTHPKHRGALILEVTKWAANTKLYKRVDQHGLQIECRLPLQQGRGKQKAIDQTRLVQWLVQWAESRHEVQLAKNAAVLLVELIGPEFGLLDQELAKLALYTTPGGKINQKLVQEHAGGWRSKTAWDLIDAALAGQGAEAFAQLDRLMQTGEHPNALFGSISWSLRRFAAATRIYQRALRQGRPIRLPEALEQAGFFKWQQDAMKKAERQLKQLGQQRAQQLYQWLLETDLALKGSHSAPDLARLVLEKLIIRLDQHLAPPRPTAARPTATRPTATRGEASRPTTAR